MRPQPRVDLGADRCSTPARARPRSRSRSSARPRSCRSACSCSPGRIRRHEDDRDAGVLLHLAVGARGEPDVVRVLAVGRVDLLAVDHPLVAVAHRGGLQAREVGAGGRLGVADADQELAVRDLREDLGLLRLAAPLHQHRADGVHGDQRERCARAPGLLPEDELVDVAATLAAVLLRPAEGEPAVLAHLPEGFAERRPTELVPLVVQRLPQFRREHRRVVVPQLLAEGGLFGGELDVHVRGLGEADGRSRRWVGRSEDTDLRK